MIESYSTYCEQVRGENANSPYVIHPMFRPSGEVVKEVVNEYKHKKKHLLDVHST
jgi:hypothetical protein